MDHGRKEWEGVMSEDQGAYHNDFEKVLALIYRLY